MSTNPKPLSFLNLPQTLGHKDLVMSEQFWQKACELRVSVPVIVVSFQSATQTVTVQPAVQESYKRNGVPTPTNLPQLSNVVMGMFRSGGFSIVATPAAGDEGWVVFADMCIGSWQQSGGSTNTQIERRRHDLSDGMFLPVGWSKPRILPDYPSTGVAVRSDDASTYVWVEEGEVTITPDSGTTLLTVKPSNIEATPDSGTTSLSVVPGFVKIIGTVTVNGVTLIVP